MCNIKLNLKRIWYTEKKTIKQAFIKIKEKVKKW